MRPGSTVMVAGKSMTSTPSGGFPPWLTLAILLLFTTISTSWRGCADVPSINVAAWMAIVFSGAAGLDSCAQRVEKKRTRKIDKAITQRDIAGSFRVVEANMNT